MQDKTYYLAFERIAMDTLVRPAGSRPQAWDVELSGGGVGQIQQRPGGFLIVPRQPTVLSGIAPGPYASCSTAMAVIADYTRGTCKLATA
jgi:hypothetical protein